MKALRLLLVLSLAANLTLLLLAPHPSASAEGGNAGGEKNSSVTPLRDAPPRGAPGDATTGAAKLGGGSDWSDLRSDDLKEVVARLRAAGFPEKVIRAIVGALVGERFAAREQQAFYGDVDPKAYWKQSGAGGIILNTPAQRDAYTQLSRERGELLKSLLGPDYMVQDEQSLAYYRRQYGDLPPEKIAQMQDLMQHYSDLRRQVAPDNRTPLPDEAPKVADLQKQMHADLANLLTPGELEQYDLRTSDTANYLRWQIQPFGASEAEYRAVYAIYQPFVDQYNNSYGNLTPEQEQARQAAEKQLQPAIAGTLGPDRYADFQQATNPQYQQLNALVSRLDLPLSASRDVAAVQTDITARATAVRSDKTLSPDERNAQLGALAQEANAKISTTLGPSGLTAYQQYGGQWMQRLQPRPAPAAPRN